MFQQNVENQFLSTIYTLQYSSFLAFCWPKLHNVEYAIDMQVSVLNKQSNSRMWESFSLFLTCSNHNGGTALHEAMRSGSLPTVKLLVKHLPSLLNVKNRNSETPAKIAASQNQHSLLKYLFEVGVKPADELIQAVNLVNGRLSRDDVDTFIIVKDEILKSSGREGLTKVEFSDIYCLFLLPSFSQTGERISQ